MSNHEEKCRIAWVDYFRGLCMFGVLAVHLGVPDYIYRLFSPFFLTGFFFVYGYLTGTKKKNIKWLCKRIKALFIPFIFFGLINLLADALFTHSDILAGVIGFLVQIPGSGQDMLWFISCLILCEILTWIIQCLFEENFLATTIAYIGMCILGFTLSSLRIQLPWHIETAMTMGIFVLIGELYRKNENRITSILEKRIAIISFVIYIALYFIFPNMYIDIHLGIYTNIPVFIITAICAIAFLTVICRHMHKIDGLQFIGKNTLVYYALQIKCFTVLKKLIRFNNTILNWWLVFLASLVILGIVAWLITRYIPEIMARKRET